MLFLSKMKLFLRNFLPILIFLAQTGWNRSIRTQSNQTDTSSHFQIVKPVYNRISESKSQNLKRLVETFNRSGRNNQLLWTIYSSHLI